MAKCYYLYITVQNHDPGKKRAIYDALNEEWSIDYPFDEYTKDAWTNDKVLRAEGCSTAYKHETQEDVSRRVSGAVWSANGTYCLVTIQSTYLCPPSYVSHGPAVLKELPVKPRKV